MLLSYKPVHLQAQQRLQEEGCVVDITLLSGTMERDTDLLEIIHTDVCSPMSVEAHSGYHCFLTFTNNLSICVYIYLMKHKSETLEKFKDFHSEVENHRNNKISFYDLIIEANI